MEDQKKQFLKKWIKIWIIGSSILFVTASIINYIINEKILVGLLISVFISLFAYWVIQFWYKNFVKNDTENVDHGNPYNKVFFNGVNFISVLLLLIGLLAAFLVYQSSGNNIFKALGVVIPIIWAVAFLRYFVWAVYFYNINYGLTDNDWERIYEAKELKRKGENIDPKDINEPTRNPYADETFGLPQGTVRGMIAFTLLFGAVSLLIVSMGTDSRVDENSAIWDQFEFFKTAFLMMIAFYFGDRSLQYLSKNWGIKKAGGTGQPGNPLNPNMDGSQQAETPNNSNSQGNQPAQNNSGTAQQPVPQNDVAKPQQPQAANQQQNQNSAKKGLIPIIDAGHGGINNKGEYTTAPSKMYTFENYLVDGKPFTIYEGEINRKIANKLINHLKTNNINYYYINGDDPVTDITLSQRVNLANEFHRQNKNSFFMSIHSNTASNSGRGNGNTAKGFEIYTSIGQTESDKLADIAAKWYKKEFPNRRFRQETSDGDADKEAKFTVLVKTLCPAFLVENLFYDNLEEAKFLASDDGQEKIAKCLFNIVKEINQLG